MILVDDRTAVMERADLEELPDYSCTLPTGTTIGKRWKRRRNYYDESKGWVMGEYAPCAEPGYVAIVWRDVLLVEENEPSVWLRLRRWVTARLQRTGGRAWA